MKNIRNALMHFFPSILILAAIYLLMSSFLIVVFGSLGEYLFDVKKFTTLKTVYSIEIYKQLPLSFVLTSGLVFCISLIRVITSAFIFEKNNPELKSYYNGYMISIFLAMMAPLLLLGNVLGAFDSINIEENVMSFIFIFTVICFFCSYSIYDRRKNIISIIGIILTLNPTFWVYFCKRWHEFSKEINYSKDEMHITTTYFKNGNKMHEAYFTNARNGYIWTYWDEQGQVIMKESKKIIWFFIPIWITKHGLTTTWFPTGGKYHEGNFKNGKKDGRWTMWNIAGNVVRKEIFKNGKVVENLIS